MCTLPISTPEDGAANILTFTYSATLVVYANIMADEADKLPDDQLIAQITSVFADSLFPL